MKAYFYKDGYLRTSCKEYNLTNLHSRMVHLTNDAVQQNSEDYGRYEPGNKLSYSDFQKYLNKDYKDLCVDFERDLVPQIQKLITDTIRATFHKIDSKRRINSFEIFGYDFMIDDNFKLYIIECNTNPCLELSAPLLGKLIPQMLDNAFRIAIDPLFMPAKGFTAKKGSIGADTTPENRFELIFDEAVDRPQLMHLFENSGMKGNDAAFDVSDEENEDEKEEEEPHQ
jgi:tubulin monoglycylase TTLL3/8